MGFELVIMEFSRSGELRTDMRGTIECAAALRRAYSANRRLISSLHPGTQAVRDKQLLFMKCMKRNRRFGSGDEEAPERIFSYCDNMRQFATTTAAIRFPAGWLRAADETANQA